MHPILAQRGRLALYLAAWVPLAGLLASLVVVSAEMGWLGAVTLALPLALVYAFICLAAWYPCRANPLTTSNLARLATTHALSAAVAAGLWLLIGAGWISLLGRAAGWPAMAAQAAPGGLGRLGPIFFGVAVLLYLLAVAVSYLLLAFEESREAEARNLELQVRAREAELTALKARQEQELAERELQLARSIQRRLLPPSEIEGVGYRIAARNVPARFVAGDFYDVFPLADGALGVVVADVAGKGMGASLIMASVKAMLPLIAESGSVAATLAELNRRLAGELAPREFVALAYARFEPASGRLSLANAGLPDPYRLAPGSPPAPLSVPGPRLPLGVRREVAYEALEGCLQPGERLFWLTDGLPEAPSPTGDPIGYQTLEELLPGDAATPAAWLGELFTRLGGATRAGSLDDDWTALVLERPAVARRDG